MRVLHVYKTYIPDNFTGIPRSIWELAEASGRYGVVAEVLSLSPSPHPPDLRVGSHISHRARQDLLIASTGLSLSVFRRFRELSHSADVVHFHFPWPLMDLLQLSSVPRKPSVVTYHSDVVRQARLRLLYAPLRTAFLKSVDAVVATSPNYRDSSAVLQRYLDKTEVIPLGLADRPPDNPDRLARWRRRFPAPFFLFVGALRYYKGLPFLLAAARSTGLPIVIAGAGDLENEANGTRPANVTQLTDLGDADREALLSLCQAFVFPSHLRSEAFGIALLEAARAGKPMISCEIGTGTSYVNIDRVTGVTVPPADAPALAAAMVHLSTSARLSEMGQAARRRYEELFTADTMAADYAGLYHRVTEKSQ